MDYPSMIYRYFTCESALEFLKTGRLRLGSPAAFNDPFELLPRTIGTRKLLQAIAANGHEATASNDESTETSISSEMAAAAAAATVLGVTASGATVGSVASLIGLGLGSPIAVSILSVFMLYESLKKKKKNLDSAKLTKSVHQFYSELVETFAIGCFSEIPDSLLMWAHYGRNYTGVVIGFNTAMDYWGNDLVKVEYSNDRINPPSSFEHSSGKPLINHDWQRKLLTTKSECWSYEQEWRVIKNTGGCDKDEKGHFVTMNHKCVIQIIVGHRIAPQKRKEIIDEVKANWRDSRICEAWPHDSRFALIIDDVETQFDRYIAKAGELKSFF